MPGPQPSARPRDTLLRAAVEHVATAGVRDQSLRTLASALGTSHRMLIYHFGSRDGLLTEVVRLVEAQQRDALAQLSTLEDVSPREVGEQFWAHVVEPALTYGALFFELSAHAMQSQPYAVALRTSLVENWLEPLADLLRRSGRTPAEARVQARLGLAVARGLLHDLLLTGDRAEVDEAMGAFVDLLENSTTAAHGETAP